MLLSRREKIFHFINYVLLFLLAFLTIFPVLYVISVSLTPLGVLTKYGGFVIIPPEITFEAYRYILTQDLIPRAYLNTIIITLAGTTINMFLTVLMAYPLSRKKLPGRTALLVFVLITHAFQRRPDPPVYPGERPEIDQFILGHHPSMGGFDL